MSHPVQYFAPVFRELTAIQDTDLTVLYCSRHGIEDREDKSFGASFAWDIPLLDSYAYKFLQGWKGLDSPGSFWGLVNPDVVRELSGGRYDVLMVHGYSYFTCWLAFLAAKVNGIPFLIRGESHLLQPRAAWRRAVKSMPLRALFSAASGYLSIGSRSADYARAYGVPDDKIYLTPYCVDNSFFAERVESHRKNREAILGRLGLSPDETVFGFFGKLYPRKAPMDLLRAFERLDGRNAALLFVGDGVDRPSMERYVRERDLANVKFVGFVNQSKIPEYYAVTDVMVLPSHVEPWGLVVNEAMASGCAVIASDVCGCSPDLVREGVTGYAFPAGDIGALADRMRYMSGNPEAVAAMGEMSRNHIRMWSPEACAQGIADAVGVVVGS